MKCTIEYDFFCFINRDRIIMKDPIKRREDQNK